MDGPKDPLEFHKGKYCPYTKNPILCQEGYCSDCFLYTNRGPRLLGTYINYSEAEDLELASLGIGPSEEEIASQDEEDARRKSA